MLRENSKVLSLAICFFGILILAGPLIAHIVLAVLGWFGATGDRPIEKLGQAGDMYGGLNAVMSGTAVILAGVGLLQANRALGMQREEMELTRREVKRSADAQEHAAKLHKETALIHEQTAKIQQSAVTFDACDDIATKIRVGEPRKCLEKLVEGFRRLGSDEDWKDYIEGLSDNMDVSLSSEKGQPRFLPILSMFKNAIDPVLRLQHIIELGVVNRQIARSVLPLEYAASLYGLCQPIFDRMKWTEENLYLTAMVCVEQEIYSVEELSNASMIDTNE